MNRDPRIDPQPGDVVVRLDWGRLAGGTKFHVVRRSPHRGWAVDQVVCYLEHADGGKLPHSSRCYGVNSWPGRAGTGALVCVIAGAGEGVRQ